MNTYSWKWLNAVRLLGALISEALFLWRPLTAKEKRFLCALCAFAVKIQMDRCILGEKLWDSFINDDGVHLFLFVAHHFQEILLRGVSQPTE